MGLTFPGEPFFAGYRELATNGITKPVLNAFRMLAKLGGERLAATSSAALPLDAILADGVTGAPDVDLIATRSENGIAILVWNYHDDDRPDEGQVRIELEVTGLAGGGFTCRHHRMDGDHSNAHALWRRQGSPEPPSEDQYRLLKVASELQLLEPDRAVAANDARITLAFDLPRHAVSLVQLDRLS